MPPSSTGSNGESEPPKTAPATAATIAVTMPTGMPMAKASMMLAATRFQKPARTTGPSCTGPASNAVPRAA